MSAMTAITLPKESESPLIQEISIGAIKPSKTNPRLRRRIWLRVSSSKLARLRTGRAWLRLLPSGRLLRHQHNQRADAP